MIVAPQPLPSLSTSLSPQPEALHAPDGPRRTLFGLSFLFTTLQTPPPVCLRHIDLYFLCFLALTKPFSPNLFIFTSIQNPRVSVPRVAFMVPTRGALCVTRFPASARSVFSATCGLFLSLGSLFAHVSLCFQSLAASFAKTPGVGVGQISCRLESPACELFAFLLATRHSFTPSGAEGPLATFRPPLQ